jgi:hypothetical protein
MSEQFGDERDDAEGLEDTRAMTADEVAAITGEAEEQDETGSPERVAHPEDEHPLESPEAIREPPDESGEEELPTGRGPTPALDND